jgi:hypothetical protein
MKDVSKITVTYLSLLCQCLYYLWWSNIITASCLPLLGVTSWAAPGTQGTVVPQSSVTRENHDENHRKAGRTKLCVLRRVHDWNSQNKVRVMSRMCVCKLLTTAAAQMRPGVGSILPSLVPPHYVRHIVSVSRRGNRPRKGHRNHRAENGGIMVLTQEWPRPQTSWFLPTAVCCLFQKQKPNLVQAPAAHLIPPPSGFLAPWHWHILQWWSFFLLSCQLGSRPSVHSSFLGCSICLGEGMVSHSDSQPLLLLTFFFLLLSVELGRASTNPQMAVRERWTRWEPWCLLCRNGLPRAAPRGAELNSTTVTVLGALYRPPWGRGDLSLIG